MTEIIKHNNVAVMTSEMLAKFFGCEKDKIKLNYSRNKKRYHEKKDYFLLQGHELRMFKKSVGINLIPSLNSTPKLLLWTEHGAFLHAKSLNTDKAWEVYHSLLNTYFQVKEYVQEKELKKLKNNLEGELLIEQALLYQQQKIGSLQNQVQVMKPKAEFYDTVCESSQTIDMAKVAKTINFKIAPHKVLGRNGLFKFLRDIHILQKNNIPYQKYIDQGYFKVTEKLRLNQNNEVEILSKTVVFQKGVDFILKLLKREYGTIILPLTLPEHI